MKHRKLRAGLAGLSITATVGVVAVGVAGAASSAPSKVTVKEKYGIKVVPNRYIQDEMRFERDTYTVRSGGTLVFEMTAPQEGPHSLSLVAKRDLPKTANQVNNCRVCNTLGAAHGANPNSNAPPRFQFLENGIGQNTPPKLDRAGDSAIIFPPKGSKVSMKVTAKRGATLYFMCIIHPWMQAVIKVK